eukprot:m.42938 g.42938  ORF g.42938 m.42938 type:complete len:397 (-) comp11601_c0_seq1:44-1234(-)
MVVKHCVVFGSRQPINDCNNPTLAPFASPDNGRTLLVERAQYDAWAQTDTLAMLVAHFEAITPTDEPLNRPRRQLTDKEREHEQQQGRQEQATDVASASASASASPLPEEDDHDAMPPWYLTVYRIVYSRNNASRWWHVLDEGQDAGRVAMVPLASADEEAALGMDDLDHPDAVAARLALADRVQAAINALQASAPPSSSEDTPDSTPAPTTRCRGFFVKCGSCSTKHSFPPEPVFTGAQAVRHLTAAPNVRRAFRRGTGQCVLLRPWLDGVGESVELRVFVRDTRVVGVSQQACYSIVPVIHLLDPEEVVAACQALWDRTASRLAPEHRFDYQCTFDAYLVTDPDTADLSARLIEINGEGFGWGAAGASLFHWVHRPPPQPNQEPVFVICVPNQP